MKYRGKITQDGVNTMLSLPAGTHVLLTSWGEIATHRGTVDLEWKDDTIGIDSEPPITASMEVYGIRGDTNGKSSYLDRDKRPLEFTRAELARIHHG